jgi:hippurate hydrolase
MMHPIPEISGYDDDLRAIRHDLHQHPEIGFEEVRTSGIVAEKLSSWGIEVHRGVGVTGVVGVIQGAPGNRCIALRADMDALPMQEESGVSFPSKIPGRFHGCGHDGHTTILLGVARYLAQTRNFPGKVVLIFQPAEESLGGARAMVADKLFERFPCDEVYALHNWPDGNFGHVSLRSGPMLACADKFEIRISGRGGHAARPHDTIDPILIGATLVQALQSIVSRNTDPLEATVLSVTKFHSGTAPNIIAGSAVLGGSLRSFSNAVREQIRSRMREICAGIAGSFGAEIEITLEDVFSVLENSPAHVEAVAHSAAEVVGADRVNTSSLPLLGSEDFADFLQVVPGAYFLIGTEKGPMVHNPGYRFDDKIIPVAASILARIAERRLSG